MNSAPRNRTGPERTMRRTGMAMAAVAAMFLSPAQAQITTQATLLDRIQLEDMLSSYYMDLTSSGRKDISTHYTADAVFDVNGILFTGRDAIQKLYDKDSDMGGPKNSRFNMLLNNPVIRINGDTATADMIFTGIISDTVNDTPRLFEQGHEHTEFVKRDGDWLIRRRAIISDGGLPKDFAKGLKEQQQKGR